jgi:transcriptional regulator with XRE-family HTH domain
VSDIKPASEFRPVVSTAALRRAFDAWAKDNWSARLDAVILARPPLRTAHVARMADTTPQTIDKIRSGEIIPKEYLRYAIAIALGCEVEALFPAPTREELFARAAALGDVA